MRGALSISVCRAPEANNLTALCGQTDVEAFKADIAARRLAGQAERERHRTFVDSFNYAAHRGPMADPVKNSPCTKPRSLVYPIRGWGHKSHAN